jgi:benzoyl-CoA reductase subunit C
MRRFHIFWKDHVKPAYIHYLNLPHTVLPASLDFFAAELAEFKRSLEEFAGVEISDERLNEVIELYNKNRALLRELSELRKPDPPLLSAVEMLETVIGGMTIPADEATELYKSVIKDVIERRRNPEKRPRLLVYGSAIDNTDFFRLIEDCGADVVIDDLCFGTRAYWHELETGRNPLAALSSYYLSKIMCPRTYRDSLEDRFGHIKRFADEFKVDGVILYAVRFCDSVELEIPVLRDYLQQAGLPVLYIEEDYIMSGIHILRTKVQAFVEMIQ